MKEFPIRSILLGLCFIVAAANASAQQAGPAQEKAGPAQKTDSTNYWARDFALRNVEAQKVISRLESLGIEIPFQLQGKVSLEATVWIPFGNLLDPTAYRFEATLTSPRLAINAVRLADASIAFRVAEGTLALRNLQGTLLDRASSQPAGTLVGTGTARLVPLGSLELTLRLQGLDLSAVSRQIAELEVELEGIAAGQVTFTHPDITETDDLQQWTAEGELEVEGFAVDSNRMWDLAIESLKVQKGVLRAGGLRAEQRTPGAPEPRGVMRGTATVQLLPAGPVVLEATIRQLDLPHAIDSLSLEVPVEGVANGTVHVENPSLDRLDDETAWTGAAELRIDRFVYEDYPAADQQLQLRIGELTLRDGRLSVKDFAAEQSVPATNQLVAAVGGSASAELFPAGPVQVDLAFRDVVLEAFNPGLLPDGELTGTAAGSLRATNPQIDRADVWNAWTGTGRLAVDRFAIGDRPAVDVVIPQYAIDSDGASLPELTIRGEDWKATAEAEYAWPEPNPFRFQLTTPGIPAADLYALLTGQGAPEQTTGLVGFDVLAKGQLDPLVWELSGQLNVPHAKLAGIQVERIQHRFTADSQRFVLEPTISLRDSAPDSASAKQTLRLGRVEAQYELSDRALRVEELFAEIFGGIVEGSATIALDSVDPEQAARHRAQLAWQGIEYAATSLVPDSDLRLASMSSGDVQWSVPADQFNDPRAHQFQANVELASLSLSGEPLGDLRVAFSSEENAWRAAIDGSLLGGTAASEITADIASVADWQRLDKAQVRGMVRINAVNVARLFAFWQTPENAQRWRGQANLQWTFRDSLEVEGAVSIVDLAYAGRRLTDRLAAQFAFDGDAIAVDQFAGSFAGGRLGASGVWRVSGPAPGLSFLLTGVDVSRALLVFSPSLAETASGIASGRILVTGQSELRASGRLDVREMEIDPFRLGTVRTGLDARFDLASQQWQLRFRNVAGSVARGRIRGQATLSSSPGQAERFNLESRWQLNGVDFEQAIEELSPGRGASGKGKLTGELTIEGRRIASVADLEGTLDARLGGTQARAVPGLPAARNQLGVLSLRNTTFEAGAIHGRFRRGTFRVSELWLASDQLRVWADGNVALASRRWNMDAVIATGNFEQANVTLLTIARQVSLDATLPVGAIMRINEALSDRIVYLRLTGPMSRPRVRIRAGQTLGENAARFFLRSLTGSLVPLPSATNRP